MKQEQYLGNAYDDKSRAGACIHVGVVLCQDLVQVKMRFSSS